MNDTDIIAAAKQAVDALNRNANSEYVICLEGCCSIDDLREAAEWCLTDEGRDEAACGDQAVEVAEAILHVIGLTLADIGHEEDEDLA